MQNSPNDTLFAEYSFKNDVLDQDACQKLSKWFDDRWNDRLCIDISNELVKAIGESWAREELFPPYYIYLKMAYHLCQEARAGI